MRRQELAGRPAHGPQGQKGAAIHPLHRHAQLDRELRHHYLRERSEFSRSRYLNNKVLIFNRELSSIR